MKRYYNVMNYAKLHHKQAGMTLIELTVVLLILIGLAGLMIPYVSGFVGKTHDSTGSNNAAQINNAVIRYETEAGKYPNNMESLITGVAGGAGAVYSDLMNTTLFAAAKVDSQATPTDATGAIRYASLNAAGINKVMDMTDGAANTNATFGSTTNSVDLTVGAVYELAAVDKGGLANVGAHLAKAFGGNAADYNTTCYDYIAFGVGPQSTMIGRTMSDAPVHFAGDQADMGPQDKYNRFVTVFRVDKDNSTAGCSPTTDRAKYVGSAMAMKMGYLFGVNQSLSHAYENMNAQLSN